jgi:AcrR family transcriptional regulator
MSVEPSQPAEVRQLRSDAERNRQRILDVAGDVFAEQGLTASMNDIAAAAGLGVGTVYRRFPDRDDLIRAVFGQRLAQIEHRALEAGDDPDPWHGLVQFFEETVGLEACDRGLAHLMDETLRRSLADRTDTIRWAVAALIVRAQESGQLRSDVDWSDFVVMRRMLTEAATTTRSVRPDNWKRMFTLLLDGLRALGRKELLRASRALADLQRDELEHGHPAHVADRLIP